jgi:predicted nucleic acid-binding protein
MRDMQDLPVLGTFVAAQSLHQADYLISGGKDLLALSDAFPIIAPAEFWQLHGV